MDLWHGDMGSFNEVTEAFAHALCFAVGSHEKAPRNMEPASLEVVDCLLQWPVKILFLSELLQRIGIRRFNPHKDVSETRLSHKVDQFLVAAKVQ